MYRNFICYRGGSSGGIQFAEELFSFLNSDKSMIGETYYSLGKNDYREIRNFLTDPQRVLGNVENFIVLLTRDFFDGFLEDGKPNANSVTRIEIDEVLKNRSVKFIPVVFPDFSWEDNRVGIKNRDVMSNLWGDDSALRIVGAPPIPFVMQYKKQVMELVRAELSHTTNKKKVVVFDFDGTLTKPAVFMNTWEAMWAILGYPISECEKYHRQFSKGAIDHDEWCEITEKYFVEAGCCKKHLIKAASEAELVDDVKEVIFELKSKGILLYILSGSIKQYIERVLGKELAGCFTEIKANRFMFDNQGMLNGIIGTPYDFAGKARFVNKIMQDKHVSPEEIIYIGNSFNDEFVYKTGVETLCINPRGTDFYNDKVWHNYIRNLKSLKEVLPFIIGT